MLATKKQRQTKPFMHKKLVEELKGIQDDKELYNRLHEVNQTLKLTKKEYLENWLDVIQKFDEVFKRAVPEEQTDKDKDEAKVTVSIPTFKEPYYKDLVIQILLFLTKLLERVQSNASFPIPESFDAFLRMNDNDIIICVLKVLEAYVKSMLADAKHHHSVASLSAVIQSRLLELAQGWGGKENGLTMVTLCDDNVKPTLPLYFDFFRESKSTPSSSEAMVIVPSLPNGQNVISLSNIEHYKEDATEILQQLVSKFAIPSKYHAALFARIRLCKAFPDPALRKQFIYVRLLAFNVLAGASDLSLPRMELFSEFLSELVDIVSSEKPLMDEIRISAINGLAAMLPDSSFLPSVVAATGCALPHGTIPTILRRAVSNITNSTVDTQYSVEAMKALFSFITVLVPHSTPATVPLKSAGLLASLIPVITTTAVEPSMQTLVLRCLETLEAFLDYEDSAAVELFRDLGGVTELIKRIAFEVAKIDESSTGKDDMSDASSSDIEFRVKVLRSLLSSLMPCLTGRLAALIEGPLPQAMKTILASSHKFGGLVYAYAEIILATLIHNEPTMFPAIQATGWVDVFLTSIVKDLIPSSSGLNQIPNTLSAICLNTEAQNKLVQMNILNPIFQIFSSPKYIRALAKRCSTLGASLDDLLRHYPALKPQALNACIKMLEDIPSMNLAKAKEEFKYDQTEGELQLDIITNVAKFLEGLMASGDNNAAFVERKGHELLMKLHMLPNLPASFVTSIAAKTLISIYHVLCITNTQVILRTFIEAIHAQMKDLDNLCAWRSGINLTKAIEANPAVAVTLNSLRALVNVLATLVRDGQSFGPNAALAAGLAEWTSDLGSETFQSIGLMQRVLLWGMAADEHSSTPTPQTTQSEATPLRSSTSSLNDNMELQSTQSTAPSKSHDSVVQLIASIHTLSKGLTKALATPSRRREDKVLNTVVQNFAKLLAAHYNWVPNTKESVSDIERCVYLANISGEIKSLLYEDKRGLPVAHTLLLHSFVSVGGLDGYFQALEWIIAFYLQYTSNKKEEELKDDKDPSLAKIRSSLVSLAKFLRYLSSPQTVINSNITGNLLTQTLPGTKGPFDPHEFIQTLFTSLTKPILALWNNPMLSKLPSNVVASLTIASKYILEKREVKKDSQEVKPSAPEFKPDPAVVTQLMDMGFSKSHVEEALRQLRSNAIPMATEWLLNNPPEENEEMSANPSTEEPTEDEDLALALAMSLGVESTVAKSAPAKQEPPKPAEPIATSSSEFDALRDQLLDKSFDALTQVEGISGYVGDMLAKHCKKRENEIDKVLSTLLDKIKRALTDNNASSLAYLTQVLALLVNEDINARKVTLKTGLVGILFDILAGVIDKHRLPTDVEAPEWVGPALLVLDSLAQLPLPTKDDEAKEKPSVDIQPLLPAEQHHVLMKICLGLLRSRLNAASVAALLLLCSRLTRNYELSSIFLEQGGADAILQLNDASHLPLIRAILRHLIEDPSTLEAAMETEITSTVTTFSARPGAKVLPKPFLTHLSGVVCRDPSMFMQAVTNVCRFQPGTTNIVLAKSQKEKAPSPPSQPIAPTTTTTTSTSTTSTTSTATPEKAKATKRTPPNLKQVILTLLNVLYERAAPEKKEPATEDATKPQPLTSVHLLQILSNFVVSYPGCSHLILKHKGSPNKGAANIIAYLLRDLLPYPSSTIDRQSQLQNQMATKLVASLCSRAEGRRKVISEISTVLEQQVGSLKTNSNAVYSIRSLADLIVLLLTSQSRAGAGVSTEMAKLMLEDKIPNVLADAMKKIDMNRPDIPEIVNAILKPLETLSKLSAIISKPKDKEEATAMDQASALQTSDIVDEIVLNTDALNQSVTEEDMETATGENDDNEEENEDEEDNEEDEEEDQEEQEEPASASTIARLRRTEQEEPEEEAEDEEEEEEEEEEDDEDESEEIPRLDINAPDANGFSEIDLGPGMPVSVTLPQVSLEGVSSPLSLLNSLLSGASITVNPTEDSSNSPFFFLLGDNNREARRVEEDVRRLFGRTLAASPPVASVNRWTDDGQQPLQPMIQFAVSLEPLLVERLTKVTSEEVALEKEKKDKQAELKPEAKESPKPEVEQPKKMEIEQPATQQTQLPQQPTPTATPVVPPSVVPTPQPSEQASQPQQEGTTQTVVPPATQQPLIPPTQPLIDPTFLEALPAELREELMASQLVQSQSPGNVASTLNPDFLAALPPEIQAEVLAQDRAEQERLRRQSEQPADPSRAEAMDNASFLATLPPDLREEILLTSDESFLATLPPHLLAEAQAVRDRSSRQYWRNPGNIFHIRDRAERREVPARRPGTVPEAKGKPVLEPESIESLLRLLYLHHTAAVKNLLVKIFFNLSSHESTREVLLNGLVSILSAYISPVGHKTIHIPPPEKNLTDAIETINLVPDTSDFSPLLNPAHALVGYPRGATYSVVPHQGNFPPLLVSRRVLDNLVVLIKNNAGVADWLVQKTDKDSMIEEVKLSNTAPISVLINLLGVPMLYQNTMHVDHILHTLSLTLKTLVGKQKKATVQPTQPKESSEATTTQPGTEPAKPEEKKEETEEQPKTEEKPEPAISLQLGNNHLDSLVQVLTIVPPCSEQAYKYFNATVEQLVALQASNRELLLMRIMAAVDNVAASVMEALENARSLLESKSASVVLSTLARAVPVEVRLLRTLKTIILLAKSDAQYLDLVNSKLRLDALWKVFETLLGLLNSKNVSEMSGMSATLSPLLPVMESFFVINGSALAGQLGATEASSNPLLSRFLRFCETYRKLLNDLIKQNPSLLQDSFSIMLKLPQMIEFENKRAYFREQIQQQRPDRDAYGEVRLNVRRNYVFEDSFLQLGPRTAEDCRGKLYIHFANEEAIDAGGVTREWYTILAKQMFNPNYALFLPSANSAFQPNKNSSINQDHLQYFKFVGRVIGKALYDGQLLDAHFTRSFYKHILGQPVHYTDIEAIDPDYYKNLKWILENDITDVLELSFTVQSEDFGIMKVVELKPGGKNIPVTNENKEEYVRLVTEHKMTTAIKPQIKAFLEGFHEMIAADLVSIFTPSELELLISGLPDIDVDDLRQNTEYKGYTVDSPQIQWFWQVVNTYDQEERALLLQFVTGTSKVPLEGFKALIGMSGPQKFQIQKSYEKGRLPTAHTCFNQLDLPEYTTKEELQRFLTIAIHAGAEGFGFG